jgi:hypothetical protein
MSQIPLPGASNALTMGIISIVGSLICCGPFAIIFSIIGLNSAGKAKRLYMENPEAYSGYENANTGKVLSYVGLALSLIMLLFCIIYFGVIIAFIMAAGTSGSY